MLKQLTNFDIPKAAPAKRSVSDNIKKPESAEKSSADGISSTKSKTKIKSNDEFASWLDNEVEKQEAGVEVEVAAVEESDLETSSVVNETLGRPVLKNELQASADLETKPVVMDSLSSEMAAPVTDEPMPKVLDGKLIQQVNDVILPEGVEATQLESAPVTMQDLLAQPKGAGRAPAIDFAKAEVDPQLLNMEDFVAQKNAFTKKAVSNQAYGMPMKGGQLTTEARKSVDAKRLQEGLDAVLKADGLPVAGLTVAALAVEGVGQAEKADVGVSQQTKVFDLNGLKDSKLDAETVMTKIADYVVQARAAKEPTVTLKMNHQDLGMIDITVNRTGNNMVSVALGAQDQNVKAFLGQHRESLMNHLSQAGVNVTDLKLEVQAQSKADSSNQHASSGQGQNQNFGSEQNQRREEQQRRQDLWDVLREKEVA